METIVSDNLPLVGKKTIRVFVNGDLHNGELAVGTSIRDAARDAARANGIIQYAVRVNNSPANLDASLCPGDTLAIEATATKG